MKRVYPDELIFGRRVYFLCPPEEVRNDLVFEIIQHEFEVYVVDDPEVAKELVYGTSSILFVNIDATHPGIDWQEYVIELKGSEGYSRVGIGILTSENDDGLRRLYIMQVGVDCGVVTLQPELSNVAGVILEVLKSNDAIGRRNAVRVECGADPGIFCVLDGADGALEAGVVNLSSQGLACSTFVPRSPAPGEYFSRIRLTLGDTEVVLSGRQFDARDDGDLHVILYDRAVDPAEREKVHRFVQHSLQQNVDHRLNGLKRQLEKRRRRRAAGVAALSIVGLAALAAVLVFLL